MDMSEFKNLVDQQGEAFTAFMQKHEAALATERKEREALELRMNRGGLNSGGGGGNAAEFKAEGEWLRKYIATGNKTGFMGLDEAKGMSVGSDPEGGYSVLPHFSPEMTKTIFQSSPMRQYARVVTISTDAFEEISDRDEVEANWVGETASRPETEAADIGKLNIPVHEIYAMPKVTQKLLDDSMIDIGSWLTEKGGDQFARKEATAFVTGTGIAKPRGFADYSTVATGDATRAWGVLQHVATGHASTFLAPTTSVSPADCLIDLQTSLKAGYRKDAVWMMNSATAGIVRKFKNAEGAYIWQQSMLSGQPDLLLGYPVAPAEDMADVGANALPIAFGNFKRGYTIVQRQGLKLMRDPFTSKPHVLFYMTHRVGGDVNNFEAIKMLKVATS